MIRMEGITKEVIDQIAADTVGFSGRELTKMVIAWHDAAFTLPDPCLTPDLMVKVLKKFHLQHKLKETWNADEAKIYEKMIFENEEMVAKLESGEVPSQSKKSEEMLKKQNIIMEEINKERLEVKEMRDHIIEEDTQTDHGA